MDVSREAPRTLKLRDLTFEVQVCGMDGAIFCVSGSQYTLRNIAMSTGCADHIPVSFRISNRTERSNSRNDLTGNESLLKP